MFIALWREGRDYRFNTLDGKDGITVTGLSLEDCEVNARKAVEEGFEPSGIEGSQIVFVQVHGYAAVVNK